MSKITSYLIKMLNKIVCKTSQGKTRQNKAKQSKAINQFERNNVCRFVPHKDPFVADASISIFSLWFYYFLYIHFQNVIRYHIVKAHIWKNRHNHVNQIWLGVKLIYFIEIMIWSQVCLSLILELAKIKTNINIGLDFDIAYK